LRQGVTNRRLGGLLPLAVLLRLLELHKLLLRLLTLRCLLLQVPLILDEIRESA
jgi:hypothetical protein